MSKPTLVFVHGWGLGSCIWNPLIETLEHEINCIRLDLPGYGERTQIPAPERLELLSRDLLEQAPENCHWLAWSLGGLAAIKAALTDHARFLSLTLIASTPKFMQAEDWQMGMDAALFKKFSDELGAEYHKGIRKFLLLQAGSGTEAKSAAKKTGALLKDYPSPTHQTLEAGLKILEESDLREDLRALKTTCQIISGTQDRIVSPEAGKVLQKNIPGSKLFELNSGHAPHLTHTDEVAGILRQILSRQKAA